MSHQPNKLRSGFFIDRHYNQWGDLDAFILHRQRNSFRNSTTSQYVLKRYKESLVIIKQDTKMNDEERTMAESLLKSDLPTKMKEAWDRVKISPSEDSQTIASLKRKGDIIGVGAGSKITEPWFSLVKYHTGRFKGEPRGTLVRNNEFLSDNHQMLYNFIFQRLSEGDNLTKLTEFDISVGLSGIMNARMKDAHNFFGQNMLNRIKSKCLQLDFCNTDKIPGLTAFLDGLNLLQFVETQNVNYRELSRYVTILKTNYITENKSSPIQEAVLDTIIYLADVRPNENMFEHKIVSIWEHVLYLFSRHSLTLVPGEIPSRATRHQTISLGEDLNIEVSRGSGGRRLDLQCRVQDLEINNSEFKRCSTSDTLLDQQYQKNLLINHSILLYLKEKVGLQLDQHELQALHVHGWTAIVFCLKKMDDIFISDFVTDTPLFLPHSPVSWKHFLKGRTMAGLWNYVCQLLQVSDKIATLYFEQQLEKTASFSRARENYEQKTLGEFTCLSPIKSRSSNDSSTESSSFSQ